MKRALLFLLLSACSKSAPQAEVEPAPVLTAKAQSNAPPPRPGMAWIPAGTLKAGTQPGRVPRIAEEELPGTEIALQGFYIDLLPYPNEPGAIATSNVTRDEAAQLCDQKGKRLCTELEWERACKGDANTVYEYGDDYKASTCGTGVTAEEAAKRPTGDKPACKSGFGVQGMHGGAWEWTSSKWGRGSNKDELGVLRGGNAVAGEIAGRCANALARPTKQKSPTMSFRCCAGPKNDPEVDLALATGPALAGITKSEAMRVAPALLEAKDARLNGSSFIGAVGWKWRPAPNETLLVIAACTWLPAPEQGTCALGVLREQDHAVVMATPTDRMVVELAVFGERRKLRALGFDSVGSYVRELTYAYGSVALGEKKR